MNKFIVYNYSFAGKAFNDEWMDFVASGHREK